VASSLRSSGYLQPQLSRDTPGTTGTAGSFVLVAGGVAHTFGATATASAHVLVLHAPALDDYFRELHQLWSGDQPPARDTELALMRRHGMQPVETGGS
jgi:hypothetical protein